MFSSCNPYITIYLSNLNRFTPEQLTIYQIVLNVQMACISICTEGKNLDTVYGIMLHLFAQELEKTDVFLEKPTAKQIFQVFQLLLFFVDVA